MSLKKRMAIESMDNYTMECYSVIKNENILSFSGKWTELENIILCEVTQTQKDMHSMSSLINGYKPKSTEYLGYNLQKLGSLTIKSQVRILQSHLNG